MGGVERAKVSSGGVSRTNLFVRNSSLDVLDDGSPELVDKRRRLYAGYGFTPLPTNDLRPLLPPASIMQLIGETG